MSETKVPSIPAVGSSNLQSVAQAIKLLLDVREGRAGDPLDANVTYRDLLSTGVFKLTPGYAPSASRPVIPVWTDPDGYDPTTDLTIPPRPEGFTATGLFAMVQLQWNTPTYRNHAYAEVWRSETNVIGDAVRIGTTDASFYSDSLGTSATRHYWIRFVSQANVNGPYNATDGVLVSTAANPGLVLASLTGQITESQLFSGLASRINLIDAPSTTAGSVNSRIGLEAIARSQQISAEQQARTLAIQQEATARTAAILSESQARQAAILTEAENRQAAITQESQARQSADSSLSSQITTLTANVSSNLSSLSAAIQNESSTRATQINAEANARNSLAAQLRGSYTGSDISLVTSGLLHAERIARASSDAALSARIDLISAASSGDFQELFAAVSEEQQARIDGDNVNASSITTIQTRLDNIADKNGQQTGSSLEATLEDNKTAQVDGDSALAESISLLSATVESNKTATDASILQESSARATAVSAEASARQSLATQLRGSYTGSDISLVTSGLIFSERNARVSADEALQTQINIISASTSGDLGSLISSVQEEQTARIAADEAEALARETLATQLRGSYTGSNLSQLTSGLLFQERQARSSADSALSSSITSLTASVETKARTFFQPSPPTATAIGDLWFDTSNAGRAMRWNGTQWQDASDARIDQSLASIAAESLARASAIQSEAVIRETLASQLRGSYNGTNINELSSGLLFSERQARSSADSALSTQISQVSARLNTGGDVFSSIVTAQNTASAKSANFVQSTTPTATKVDDLWIDTANGNILKRWNGTAWVNADDTRIGASATSITQLSSRIDNVSGSGVSMEQRFSTNANQITGLQAQYTVKVDVNGYVSGFGLASTAINSTPLSSFTVRADNFLIGNPGGPGIAPATPFIVRTTSTTVNGVSVPVGVYISDAFIQNGTITNAKIGNAAIDNAKIANVDATKITTGFLSADRIAVGTLDAKLANISAAIITSGTIASARIGDGTITSAKIADTIQSTNFAPGLGGSGWRIDRTGNMEINTATFRGTIDVRSASSGARLEIRNNVIRVFDNNGVLRVRIGDLAA
jgi:hypothetical protein